MASESESLTNLAQVLSCQSTAKTIDGAALQNDETVNEGPVLQTVGSPCWTAWTGNLGSPSPVSTKLREAARTSSSSSIASIRTNAAKVFEQEGSDFVAFVIEYVAQLLKFTVFLAGADFISILVRHGHLDALELAGLARLHSFITTLWIFVPSFPFIGIAFKRAARLWRLRKIRS